MTDRRGPLSTYLPTPSPQGPGVPKPVERPTLGQVYDAATTTSRADLPSAERDRLYDAYAPILQELNRDRSWFRRYHNPGAGGANFDAYLTDEEGYAQFSAPSREFQETKLWRAIDDRRAVDPKAFPGVPATREEFHAKILADAKAKLKGARETIGRNDSWAGTAAEIGAGVATSFRDPINIAAMPLGGVGRSVATRIVTSALANMAVEAVEQPIVAQQREKLGETLTTREAAINVAAAGAFGGVLQGVGEAAAPLARAAGNAFERGRGLATSARERIGWANMTPPEKIAVLSLERDADIAGTSPFRPGAGTDAHVARIEKTVAGLKAAEGVPPIAAPQPFDFKNYANRTGIAESGGRWDIGAKTSSAYGLYQITRGTWLRYAEQARIKGVSDDATWAKRTNPAAQEAVFTAITRDNRAALARAGAPETFGNLYLMHFAGAGAGAKILKAAPGTPIERVLSAKAIEANGFLRGKTTDDVIAWAHAKMGQERFDGPVLSRSGFDEHDAGDVEWRAAQAEVEAAERALADARRADVDEAMPRSTVDDDVPFDLDDPRGLARDGPERDPFADLPDDMIDAVPARIEQAMDAEPVRASLSQAEAADLEARGLGPASMLSFVGKEGAPGVSFMNEGGNFATAVYRDAKGQAQGIVRMPISDEARAIGDEVSSYVAPAVRRQGIATKLYDSIRDNGFDIDSLSGMADLTPDGAAFVNARRARPADAPASSTVPTRYRDWQSPNDELDTYWRYQAETEAGSQPVWAMRDADGAIVKWAPEERQIRRELDREFFPENFTVEQVAPTRGEVEIDPGPTTIAGFDHPDDVAATRQIDSMVHDLKMLAEAEPAMAVRDADGQERPLADVLADLDADEAAVEAARRCM